MMRHAGTLIMLGALAVAGAAAARQPAPSREAADSAVSDQGLALAKGTCGACHAVERHAVSPNPKAPPFAAVVNQRELTAETLSSWLRDAHNYPAEMQFDLEGLEVDALVAYMLTLRDPNYRPAI